MKKTTIYATQLRLITRIIALIIVALIALVFLSCTKDPHLQEQVDLFLIFLFLLMAFGGGMILLAKHDTK